jgi:uroporphyrinogen decarboxylase
MLKNYTHRQRVINTLNHKVPDRIPRDMGGVLCSFMEGSYKKLKKHLGLNEIDTDVPHPDWFVITEIDERIYKRFDIDFRNVYLGGSSEYKRVVEGNTWVDEIGFTRKFSGTYGEIVDHPLRYAKDVDDIKKFKFYDAYDPARVEGLKERLEYLYNETDYAITAASPFIGLLEGAHWFRGFDQFPVDLLQDKKIAHAMLDKITTYYIELMDAYLSVAGPYVHVVRVSDDLSGQTNMLISPELYREMILPYWKRLISFIKTKTKAKVFQHCCGASVYAAEFFVEAGVDIVNSLQPRAAGMDSTYFKDKYGDKLVFHGGIDIQWVLPFGTVKDVEEEVKRRIAIYAPGGGYVIFPAHDIQPDTPPENVIAMYDAIEKWGNYPLSEEILKLRETIPHQI